MEIKTIAAFLPYYKSIRERTKKLIEVIPADKMDWAYKPGKFTVGDQIRHIAAMERFMFAENVAGRPSAYSGCGKELANGYENIVTYMNNLHIESLSIFSNLTDADLQTKCSTPGNIEITVWKWLRAMIEHEVHHRAQLYLYMNMLDIATPPIFGLTAEEVQARSIIKK